jgi:hypothetical protein
MRVGSHWLEELTVRITVIGIPKVSRHCMKFLWVTFNRCLVCSECAQNHRSALFNSTDYCGRGGTKNWVYVHGIYFRRIVS